MKVRKLFIVGLLSCCAGFLFTIIIYNFNVILYYLTTAFSNRITIYIATTFFYYYLFLFLKQKVSSSNYIIFLLTVVTPVLIDASVLITNPSQVPLRFPFVSVFPVLGASLGCIKLCGSKLSFRIGLLVVTGFFFITYKFILPELMILQFQNNSKKVKGADAIFSKRFYDVNDNPVILGDTCTRQVTLLECFFVGCPPCEQKVIALDTIRRRFATDELQIVFICDGAATSYKNFTKYTQNKDKLGYIFLYDKDKVLRDHLKIPSYPFEILCNNKIVSYQLDGFGKEIVERYVAHEIKRIKLILNE